MPIFVISISESTNWGVPQNKIFKKKLELSWGGVQGSRKFKSGFLRNEHDRFVASIQLITAMLLFLGEFLGKNIALSAHVLRSVGCWENVFFIHTRPQIFLRVSPWIFSMKKFSTFDQKRVFVKKSGHCVKKSTKKFLHRTRLSLRLKSLDKFPFR